MEVRHQTVLAVEHENLRDLFNVRHDVVMREHHSLWIAGTATGKNTVARSSSVFLAP